MSWWESTAIESTIIYELWNVCHKTTSFFSTVSGFGYIQDSTPRSSCWINPVAISQLWMSLLIMVLIYSSPQAANSNSRNSHINSRNYQENYLKQRAWNVTCKIPYPTWLKNWNPINHSSARILHSLPQHQFDQSSRNIESWNENA